jgi:CARDB
MKRDFTGGKRRSIHRRASGQIARSFLIESLESRTLFVTASCFPTFAGAGVPTGDGALTVAPNATVTIRVYVMVDYDYYGPQYDPTPTGQVALEWFRTDNYGDAIGQPGTLIPQSQGVAYTDITVTLTKSTDPYVVVDQSGDYRMRADYLGDDALFPETSLPVAETLNNQSGTAVEQATQPYQDAFMGVKFVNKASLSIAQQPTDTAEGDTISAVKVNVLDASGNVDTSSSSAISVTIGSGTGDGTLKGTLSVNASSGVATFSDLSIDKAGHYVLHFSDTSGNTVDSNSIQIGEPLEFVNPVPTTPAATAIDPPVQVEVKGLDGNPDAAATGMVTLSLTSFKGSGTGKLSGTLMQPLVGGVATFSDLKISKNGAYQLHPTDTNDDVSIDSNKFQVGKSDVRFEINSRAAAGSKGAVAGSLVLYSITVAPKKSVQEQTIVDTFPANFTVDGIPTGGGQVNGNTITWNTNLRLAAFNFELRVPDDVTLSNVLNGATSIPNNAEDNITYADGSTAVATASNSTKLNIQLVVKGSVNDALFDYPKRTAIVTQYAPPHTLVELIDDTGAVVATTKPAGDGVFKIKAPKGGDYTLEFVATVNTYGSAADGYSNQKIFVGQDVSMPKSNTTPIDLGKMIDPVTFFNSSAKILFALNNYGTQGFQNLPLFNIDFLRFDTTGAESVLSGLFGTAADPTAPESEQSLHNGTMAEDQWVAAFRMMGGLSEINERFFDTLKLTDQGSKALSVILSAKFSQFLGKNVAFGSFSWLKGKGLDTTLSNSLLGASILKTIQSSRILGFTALGDILPITLNSTPGDIKNYYFAIIFSFLRYISDAVSGKLLDDLGFEAVFNLIRITADTVILESLCGVKLKPDFANPVDNPIPGVGKYLNYLDAYKLLPGLESSILANVGSVPGNMQSLIDSCVSGRFNYNANPITDQALTALDMFDSNLKTEAIKGMRNTSAFSVLFSTYRGTSGVEDLLSGIKNPNTAQAAVQNDLGLINRTINKSLGYEYGKGTQNYADNPKAAPPSGAATLEGDLMVATLGSAAFSVAEQVSAATDIPNIVNTATISGIFGVPLTSVGPLSVISGSTNLPTTTVTTAPQTAAPADANVSTPADASAFLADLAQMQTLVKSRDVNGLTALASQFTTDDQALFSGDLIMLDSQANAVYPQLSQSHQDLASIYDTDVKVAVNDVLYTDLELGVWGGKVSTANNPMMLSQLSTTIAAINVAVNDAALVRQAIAGYTIPAALVIDQTSVPSQMTTGTTQSFTFTVTNIGSTASDAGTITFANNDNSLNVQGGATQTLPSIAAGASAIFTWQVQAGTPANAGYGSVFSVSTTAGTLQDQLSDEVMVG